MGTIISNNTKELINLVAELNSIEERFTAVLPHLFSAANIDAYYNKESANFDALTAYFGKCLVQSIIKNNTQVPDALKE